ncbi:MULTISPECIES: DNA/RNA non-specific endonuclease [Microbacterium]|uniref:DNA/RNA non-specific endonuclease n=1 Tax=Microbacterium TaxID=33882 RepID=UPI00217D5AB6|nr:MULTISPECIES: DNA/RNA non-specific endonuclease [Microbacterium]UWF77491.1 DNA/RNA non-specific endonuclease [Microbacterium neungamense]WCM55654.1 DNA/RNA non-specific endonuclease [Microbacterium sp. EF45047]
MADGYDPHFLATELPLPRPAQPVRGLPYPRFTVLLDPERRMAAVTGVNIDGALLQDLARTGEWHRDPRVAPDEQTGPEMYARNDLDRGHLVRRRDPGWGDVDEARRAMDATFAYPNAAPQAAGFNQSKELWLGLEDHVLGYADATDQRLSVFTAPVLGGGDPPYRGIRIPLRFWKLAAWRGPTGLAAAGFVLDQSELIDTRDGLLAVHALGAFRTFQVPIAEIAELTGVDLGPLPDADVLAARTARPGEWRMLRTPADIVL